MPAIITSGFLLKFFVGFQRLGSRFSNFVIAWASNATISGKRGSKRISFRKNTLMHGKSVINCMPIFGNQANRVAVGYVVRFWVNDLFLASHFNFFVPTTLRLWRDVWQSIYPFLHSSDHSCLKSTDQARWFNQACRSARAQSLAYHGTNP
jgi:hypothetical protein